MRKNFKIENTSIKLTQVKKDYIVLDLTGVENGFETLVKLTYDQADQIYRNLLYLAYTIPGKINEAKIEGIHMKHREYTRLYNEEDFTTKYTNNKECFIQIVSVGGHCIINLGDKDHNFRSESFRICQSSIENFVDIAKAVREQRFRIWD